MRRHLIAALVALATALPLGAGDGEQAGGGAPNILFITVDTLRSDRMSHYGYKRQTSPNLDALMARGAWFSHARTIEPLTNPALASMLIYVLMAIILAIRPEGLFPSRG